MAQALPGAAALSDWLTVEVPGAIIAGAGIPPRPAVTVRQPRRWRSLRVRPNRGG
jgi:hypothetical protein